jgi:hypothetical protein
MKWHVHVNQKTRQISFPDQGMDEMPDVYWNYHSLKRPVNDYHMNTFHDIGMSVIQVVVVSSN